MFRGVCSLQSVKYFWQSSAVYLAQMVFFSDLPRPSLSNVFNSMETTPVLQTSNSILTGFAAKQESVVRQCLSIALFRWWLSRSLATFKRIQIVESWTFLCLHSTRTWYKRSVASVLIGLHSLGQKLLLLDNGSLSSYIQMTWWFQLAQMSNSVQPTSCKNV